MARGARRIGRVALSLVALGLLAYPCHQLHLYAMRECYRLSEVVGLMSPGGSLGGQVMGFNFQRNPAWVHWPVRGVAAAAGFAPAVGAAVLILTPGVRPRLAWSWRAPSNRCDEPAGLRERSHRLLRLLMSLAALRVLPCAVAFGAAHVYVAEHHQYDVSSWVLERGVDAGCDVFRSGPVLIGVDGPFMGGGRKADAWNFAWRNLPWLATAGAGLAAAAAVHAAGLLVIRDPAARWAADEARCSGCGYSLRGLDARVCPECGARFEAARPA